MKTKLNLESFLVLDMAVHILYTAEKKHIDDCDDEKREITRRRSSRSSTGDGRMSKQALGCVRACVWLLCFHYSSSSSFSLSLTARFVSFGCASVSSNFPYLSERFLCSVKFKLSDITIIKNVLDAQKLIVSCQ